MNGRTHRTSSASLATAVVWIARAGNKVLTGVFGREPSLPVGPATVYVDDFGERPLEVVHAANQLGCAIRAKEREASAGRFPAARGVTQEFATLLADGLRHVGAVVTIEVAEPASPE